MIVLGVDQGLSHCGYSILKTDPDFISEKNPFPKGHIDLYKYGCIITTNKLSLPERMLYIDSILETLVLSYKPELICCEQFFYTPPLKGNRNKSSSIIYTNEVTGLIVYIAGKYNIKFKTFVPGHVKKLICNDGRATKKEMIEKVTSFFRIKCKKIELEHICDSVSIGITGCKWYKDNK